jgi:hypothetical protein
MLAISLFWIGAVLILAAMLMLFWDSFQHRKLWALISLLLVIPLIIHMVLNWSHLNSRKAFYIAVLGILSIMVSIAGGALSELHFLPEHKVVQALEDNIAPPKEVPLPNQEKADAAALTTEENYDPLLTGSEYETLETKEIVPEDVNKVNPKTISAARYQDVSQDEREQVINKWIRLTMSDGKVVEGRLTDVLEDAVLVESTVGGGSLGLSYRNEDIASMAVRLEAGEQLAKPDSTALPEGQAQAEDVTDDVNDASQEIIEDVSRSIEQQINEDIVSSEELDTPNVEHEVIKPEINVLDQSLDQPSTEQTLDNIEEIVNDSKSVNTPIDQL